jgi:hypothetical protein
MSVCAPKKKTMSKYMTAIDYLTIHDANRIDWKRLCGNGLGSARERELLRFGFETVAQLDAWTDVARWDGRYSTSSMAGPGVRELERRIGAHPEGLSGAGVACCLSRVHDLCANGVGRMFVKRDRKKPMRFKPY